MNTLRHTLAAACAAALVACTTLTAGAGLLALAPTSALAQEDSDDPQSLAFEAATGAQTEQIPGGTLMVVAYGLVWVLVLGYVMSLGFHQARTRRELDRLRADIESSSPSEHASE